MDGKRFVNRAAPEEENGHLSIMLKWMFSKNPQKEEKAAENYRPPVSSERGYLDTDEDVIVWMGHASFFIRLNGTSLLTDPCFRDLPGMKRNVPAPFHVGELPSVDYVLISHNHRDHLDLRSLRGIFRAHPGARALLPLHTGKLLRKVTGNILEAGWYQQFDTDDRGIDICFLPAIHWCMRRPGDRITMLWGSFIIRSGETTGICMHRDL